MGYTLKMSDEMTIGGKQYISSKRAAEISDYTQDYIGQLARGGAIAAKRIGGHWYVSESSLRAYKMKADEYKPQPPAYVPSVSEIETSVSFDGREFISASAAAKLSGYHQDYIGQLARSGKVASRQIGNRWFIERNALLCHKSEKDSLLAAVQTQSVGLHIPVDSSAQESHTALLQDKAATPESKHALPQEPFFSYTAQGSDLMPMVAKKTPSLPPAHAGAYEYREHATFSGHRETPIPIPIRHFAPAHQPMHSSERRVVTRQKKRASHLVPLAGVALTIVVVLSFGFTSLKDKALYALGEIRSHNITQAAGASGVAETLRGVIERLEELFSRELHYQAERK